MLNSLRFTFALALICSLSGCVFESTVVLSDPKDRIFPFKEGAYVGMGNLSAEGLSGNVLEKNFSPAERTLLNLKSPVPDLEEDGNPKMIEFKKIKGGYTVSVGGESGAISSFEALGNQTYLAEVYTSDSCLSKGVRPAEKGVDYYFVKIVDDGIYTFSDGEVADDFKNWAVELGFIDKQRYGVKTEQAKNKTIVTLSSTKAMKAYYAQNTTHFQNKEITLLYMPAAKAAKKYSVEMALAYKVTEMKKKLEAAETVLKQKEEEEKNDGVIRWAFGRKLGSQQSSQFDTITYHNVTNLAQKSSFFQEYYEISMPESKKVFSIYAISGYLSAMQCKEQAQQVMSVLREKYGKPTNPHWQPWSYPKDSSTRVNESFLYFKRIEQEKEGRLVELVCVTDKNRVNQIKNDKNTFGCQLDENLYNDSIAKSINVSALEVSKYNLYFQYPGQHGYSDYGYKVIPIWIPSDNVLYPAPVPSLSASYSQNYRKCRLDINDDIFRLFVRYSDTNLENNIISERANIKHSKALNTPEATGL